MPTPARYRALQWLLDHERTGPDGVFTAKPPSARMRKIMAKDGQVMRIPVGQFEHYQWRLTPEGREVLRNQPTPRGRRRSLPRIHKEMADT